MLAGLLGLLAVGPGCARWSGARLYVSGSRALEAGDTARAIRDLEAAARRVPQASEVLNHLGIAYLAEGRTADARRAFARAVELDCANAAAAHNLELLGEESP